MKWNNGTCLLHEVEQLSDLIWNNRAVKSKINTLFPLRGPPGSDIGGEGIERQ